MNAGSMAGSNPGVSAVYWTNSQSPKTEPCRKLCRVDSQWPGYNLSDMKWATATPPPLSSSKFDVVPPYHLYPENVLNLQVSKCIKWSAAIVSFRLSLVQSLLMWYPIYNKHSRSMGQRSRSQHDVMHWVWWRDIRCTTNVQGQVSKVKVTV